MKINELNEIAEELDLALGRLDARFDELSFDWIRCRVTSLDGKHVDVTFDHSGNVSVNPQFKQS